jgi:CTP:molybdopterin cytidylyltransferase MocA
MSCCDPTTRPVLAAVLLAAGASARMGGQPKALLQVAGETLVVRLARQLCEAGFATVHVVVGAHAVAIQEAVARSGTPLARALTWVENPDWESGVGGSLRCGLARALVSGTPAGVLVAPVDLPVTRAEDWELLRVRTLSVGRTTAVAHGTSGEPGAPVLFALADAREVLETLGLQGAQPWLRANRARIEVLDCPRLSWDADTPEALANLLARA